MSIPKAAPEMPLAIPRLAPKTVLMSLVLSALSTAGVLECGLCSFLMAGPIGRWLRGCFKTTSSFFSATVAGIYALRALGSFPFRWGPESWPKSADIQRNRNANVR